MMREMMKQCCTEDGKPGFEKMKHFMEHCGKQQFSEDELVMTESKPQPRWPCARWQRCAWD
jgi:hypothetical protein